MAMARKPASALLAAAILLAATSALADDAKVQAAQQAAEPWVKLVDDAKYGESWDAASSLFKKGVARDKWAAMAKPVREPLGKVISRKLAHGEYSTDAPGVPDGEYVFLQFQTSFEKKKSAVETVVMALEPDGKWRAAGYFIK
ncbi:MAG: DUF4019 domain-containing protein [Bryobacteraceae bacterium]|nr:DUF4019 domain-containing protein [Bryobacteraceae bacterium]